MNGENHSEHDLSAINSKYKILYYSGAFQELIKFFAKTVDRTITSKFGKFIPTAVLVSSVGMTAGFWKLEQDSITQDVSNHLDKQLLEATYPVVSRIHDYEQILLSIQGLFRSSNIITREENRLFMESSLNIGTNSSDITGNIFPEIDWVSISFRMRDGLTADTSNGKSENYASILNEEGFLNLGASRKGENAKTAYIEPFKGNNLSFLANDNLLDPIRRSMFRLSQYKDEAVLSDPIHSNQEVKKEASLPVFLMAYPIYVKWASHTTQEERDKNLLGWATVSFDFGKLIPQVSQNSFSDMNLQIYVGDGEGKKTLIFNSSPLGEVITQPRFTKSKTITVANKDFTFVVNSTGSLEKSMFYKGYLNTILYSGALVTFLLTISSYFFIRGRKEALGTIKELKAALKQNEFVQTHDTLTGLVNRDGFIDLLEIALTRAEVERNSVALMHIDLDEFKKVNDNLGHDIGNELLKQVAIRIKECFQNENITLGRTGGNEFSVLIKDIVSPINNPADYLKDVDLKIHTPAMEIIRSLERHFFIEGNEIHITCSVGSALYPEDSLDSSTLLRHADLAIHSAKKHGGADMIFSSKIEEDSIRRGRITLDLRHAIERDELYMMYQPIVNIETKKITSMEALLRWKHPDAKLGGISPAEFIPIAESTGSIVPIGKWTIRAVCEQIVRWREQQGIYSPKIAVNLSAKQFLSKTLFEDIMQILKETGVSPKQIGLEITEGTLFHNMDDAIRTFHKFKKAGFEISIDDFGTGFSNLSYLARFDVSILKIDRAFILEMHTEKGLALVKSIISTAHSLGIRTIAEGVESEKTVKILGEYGCDNIQGYFFGRPEDADTTAKLLSSSKNDGTEKK